MAHDLVIVDYGMGNLRSVQKALERLGVHAPISSTPEDVEGAKAIVVPGVGAFGHAMAGLTERKLLEPILRHVEAGRPYLGICLGLQLLFERSYEDGTHRGLGVLRGEVVRFPEAEGLKVPHMGWNQVWQCRPAPLFRGVSDGEWFYFVHSFFASPAEGDVVAGQTEHGVRFCSVVWKENVVACQFHPEKSQQAGLRLLEAFLRWAGVGPRDPVGQPDR